MSEYQITCCSTADMPAQYFEEKKIPFVCFNFLMDGVQYPDDLGKSMPFKEFYKKIADGAEPTTAQVNTQQYMELIWTDSSERSGYFASDTVKRYFRKY